MGCLPGGAISSHPGRACATGMGTPPGHNDPVHRCWPRLHARRLHGRLPSAVRRDREPGAGRGQGGPDAWPRPHAGHALPLLAHGAQVRGCHPADHVAIRDAPRQARQHAPDYDPQGGANARRAQIVSSDYPDVRSFEDFRSCVVLQAGARDRHDSRADGRRDDPPYVVPVQHAARVPASPLDAGPAPNPEPDLPPDPGLRHAGGFLPDRSQRGLRYDLSQDDRPRAERSGRLGQKSEPLPHDILVGQVPSPLPRRWRWRSR